MMDQRDGWRPLMKPTGKRRLNGGAGLHIALNAGENTRVVKAALRSRGVRLERQATRGGGTGGADRPAVTTTASVGRHAAVRGASTTTLGAAWKKSRILLSIFNSGKLDRDWSCFLAFATIWQRPHISPSKVFVTAREKGIDRV